MYKNLILGLIVFLLASRPCFSLEKPGEELKEVGLTTALGSGIDLGLVFQNSEGKQVDIKSLIVPNRPVVLVPVYYSCPRMCGLILKGVSELVNSMPLEVGKDYSLVTVSFDTSEKPSLAAKRRTTYIDKLNNKPAAERGWHFLVGDDRNVDPLMNQIGFNYRPDQGEFAHTAAIMLLTPSGEISQYFTGIQFPASDVKLALVEASHGNIGTTFDHLLLYCFRFDPTKGKYTWAVLNLLRVAGVLSIIFLGGLLLTLWWREKKSALVRGS